MRSLASRCLALLAASVFLASALAADPAAPATSPALQTIQVKDTKEFMAAIGSNRIIQLLPGEYDLSEIEEKNSRNVRWGLDPAAPDDALIIRHVENLTIECPGDKPARIITPDAGIYILTFQDVSHLTLRNLQMVHDVQAECAGGVVYLTDCRDVTIDKCTLSGCGTEGLCAAEVDGLTFSNSTITHCSEDILTATELSNARFIDSTLSGNILQMPALNFTKSPSVTFTRCTLSDNKAPAQSDIDSFISLDDDECHITFTGCTFSGNGAPDFAIGDGSVTAKDCTMKDNSFNFQPGDKPKPKPTVIPGMGMGGGMGAG